MVPYVPNPAAQFNATTIGSAPPHPLEATSKTATNPAKDPR